MRPFVAKKNATKTVVFYYNRAAPCFTHGRTNELPSSVVKLASRLAKGKKDKIHILFIKIM
jgi:hypothetical protein